jgi:hypothetical protein
VTRAEQLALPLVLDDEPTRPASWVARFLGVPLLEVNAAIDTGRLPATYDGEQWQVPLWAVPTLMRDGR